MAAEGQLGAVGGLVGPPLTPWTSFCYRHVNRIKTCRFIGKISGNIPPKLALFTPLPNRANGTRGSSPGLIKSGHKHALFATGLPKGGEEWWSKIYRL